MSRSRWKQELSEIRECLDRSSELGRWTETWIHLAETLPRPADRADCRAIATRFNAARANLLAAIERRLTTTP